jgi:hypothetical protein
LLRALTAGVDVEMADAPDQLRRRYGARPDEEFIHEAWETLRESWLAIIHPIGPSKWNIYGRAAMLGVCARLSWLSSSAWARSRKESLPCPRSRGPRLTSRSSRRLKKLPLR